MSLLPSRRSADIAGGSRSLFPVLAFLLLLTLPQHLAEGGPAAAVAFTELRCLCLNINPKINPKMIANLEVIAAGPQCPRVEVIAKLKNQQEVCLDPEAPLIKKIIQKILDGGNKKTKRNTFLRTLAPVKTRMEG
ncbi:C-X-C motif chemokine 6 [Sigmodon hispidus]